jgi:hypothetical protein
MRLELRLLMIKERSRLGPVYVSANAGDGVATGTRSTVG